MKIGPFEPKASAAPVSVERKAVPTGRSEATSGSAKVELSAAATLQLDPNGEGSFDAAKVERIAQAIRDGSFTVNAGAIADKLIANAQELLDRTPRP
ncbi:MAG: flagellar biosynthesis anti-sigma factor FlgM [Rubrivivax sp.]